MLLSQKCDCADCVLALAVAGKYSSGLQAHACDLLCFCVLQHGFRVKFYLLKQNVISKVLRLLRHRERFVQLGTSCSLLLCFYFSLFVCFIQMRPFV